MRRATSRYKRHRSMEETDSSVKKHSKLTVPFRARNGPFCERKHPPNKPYRSTRNGPFCERNEPLRLQIEPHCARNEPIRPNLPLSLDEL